MFLGHPYMWDTLPRAHNEHMYIPGTCQIRHVNDESSMPRSRIFNLGMLVLEILRGCRLSCGTDGPCKVKRCGELTLHWTSDH